jgi:hypothetical protein
MLSNHVSTLEHFSGCNFEKASEISLRFFCRYLQTTKKRNLTVTLEKNGLENAWQGSLNKFEYQTSVSKTITVK